MLVKVGTIDPDNLDTAVTTTVFNAVLSGMDIDLPTDIDQTISGIMHYANLSKIQLDIEGVSEEQIQQRIEAIQSKYGIDMGTLSNMSNPNAACKDPTTEPETPREQGFLNGMLYLQITNSEVIHQMQHNPSTATDPNETLAAGTGATLYGINTQGSFNELGNHMTFTVIEDEKSAQQLRESLEEHGLTIVHGTIDNALYIIGINDTEFDAMSSEQKNEIIETINEFDAANTEKAHDKTLASTEDYSDPNELQNTNYAKPYLPA